MIVLLTYDAPHRKTQDVAWRLLTAGKEFRVVAVPWEERRPRKFLYAHRPSEMTWPCDAVGDPNDFFKAFNIDYTVSAKGWLFEALLKIKPELIVLGGAGILPEDIVESFDVLNVHPGILPQCRGLDILKWSILEQKLVGVTAHLCDKNADLGWRIAQKVVPVYDNDTFHSFAMRQYEMEVGLIVPAINVLEGKTRSDLVRILAFGTESRRRMKTKTEADLLAAFDSYKTRYVRRIATA